MSALTEDLKQHIDIIDYIGRYVDLKRAGSNYTGLCPFHREKSPSFMVSHERQTFKCFGCGVGGDVISFSMEYDKMDFRDAIKDLSSRYHFDLTPYKDEKSNIEGYLDTKDQREKLKLINKLTAKWFHDQLDKYADASDYVHDRRQLDDEVINHWQIGYAPNNIKQQSNNSESTKVGIHENGQLLNQYLQSKGFTVADLTEAGLIKQSQSNTDIYNFFRHRMMFPISDHTGNIVGFGGRIINPEDSPKYLNTSETPIYQKSKVLYGLYQAKSHIKTYDQVIIVEGYMDVIALERLGLPIGVAPCGTSLTLDHIKLLTRHTQNIITLFDNDNAGQTASIKSIKLMLEQGIYPKVIKLPTPYKDIDDLANADLSDDSKKALFSSPIDWFDALIQGLQVAYPLDHPVAMKQLINEMFAALASIGDFSVFMGYLNKLAKLVNIDESGLLNQYKQRHRTNKSITRRTTETTTNYEEDIDLLLVSISNLLIYQNLNINGTNYSSTLTNIKVDQVGILIKNLYSLAYDLYQLKKLPEYTPSQLEEGVLWWSRTIDQINNNKQLTELQQFISRYIQANTQLIIKSSTLTLDEKQIYLTRIKGIK